MLALALALVVMMMVAKHGRLPERCKSHPPIPTCWDIEQRPGRGTVATAALSFPVSPIENFGHPVSKFVRPWFVRASRSIAVVVEKNQGEAVLRCKRSWLPLNRQNTGSLYHVHTAAAEADHRDAVEATSCSTSSLVALPVQSPRR
jgi:hypothetical protein